MSRPLRPRSPHKDRSQTPHRQVKSRYIRLILKTQRSPLLCAKWSVPDVRERHARAAFACGQTLADFCKVCNIKVSHSGGSLREVHQKSCRVNPALIQRCVSRLASKGIALVDARISLRRTSSSPPLTFSGIVVESLFRSLRANGSLAPSVADTRCRTPQ